MEQTALTVERVILRQVRIPLREPFRIANGEVTLKESTIVELHSDSGKIGFGEASPMSGSFYSDETPESTGSALANDLVPDILHRTIQSPVSYAELLNDYKREPFARAGIEGAVWDLCARQLHTSIRELLCGSQEQRPLESGLAVGMYDSIETLLARISTYLADGYRRTKIKIQPGWDVEPLSAIRNRFGDIPLMVDANCSYKLNEHAAVLRSLDTFGLMMIEQPFASDAIEDLASLARDIRTPICVDESADNLDSLEYIINAKAAQIINIKVQRVGGLWNARRMHDRALRAGLACWLGTMPELAIASSQSLSIAGLPGFLYPTDVEASDRWFIEDLTQPKITISPDGLIEIPDGPDGYKVSRETLEDFTVRTETFE